MKINNPNKIYLKNKIKVGDQLKAINLCKMEYSGKQALIIGKKYLVKRIDECDNNPRIKIESEIDQNHSFPIKLIDEYFTLA